MEIHGTLGIDSAAIDEYYRQCEEMVSKVFNFAEKYGYKDDAEMLNADLRKRIFADLRLDDTTKDITTEIINSCLQATGNLLEDTMMFDGFGLYVDGSADSSNRYFCVVEESSGDIYYSDNVERLLNIKLTTVMRDRVCEAMGGEYTDDERSRLFVGLLKGQENGRYDDKDIIACVQRGEVSQAIEAEFKRYLPHKANTSVSRSTDIATETIYRECARYVSNVQIMAEERGYDEPRFDLRKEVVNLMASGQAQSEREAILTATQTYLDNSVLLKDCGLLHSHVGYYENLGICSFVIRFAGDQDEYARNLQTLERDIDEILTGRLATDIKRGEYAVEKKTDDTIVLKKKETKQKPVERD